MNASSQEDELSPVLRLALVYAPAELRGAYEALLHFDSHLARIAFMPGEPMMKQIRLAWWREAVAELGDNAQHPVLVALSRQPFLSSSSLSAAVDAWEMVAVAQEGRAGLSQSVGTARAGMVADIATAPASAALVRATTAWALADLVRNGVAETDGDALRQTAADVPSFRLPRPFRPVAILVGLARRALKNGHGELLGDRLSPLVALRLGILGR